MRSRAFPAGSRPLTRTLPTVLRRQLDAERLRFLVAEVVSTPDSAHVTIAIGGANITVPRLASYTAPVVGEPCYCLAGSSLTIAIGAVR